MATGKSWRRLFAPTGVVLAGLLAGLVVWAQTIPPLTSQWSSGAVPGTEGIWVSAFPIVTGEPFTAENNSRSIWVLNDKKIVNESHSIMARDSEGRVATRRIESPHVSLPHERGSTFIGCGGSVTDPVAMAQMQWTEGGLFDKVVMKYRILPNTLRSSPQPLDACEQDSGHTRTLRNGETEQIEDLGDRAIQGLLTRGCRVTTFIPAGTIHNDQPITVTDDRWSSIQFRITLLHVRHESSGGDSMEQLDNIVRGEPDPSLFHPPPGYTVRDMDTERAERERGQVTMEPGGPDAEMLAGDWETDDPFAGKPHQLGILLVILANRRVPLTQGKVIGGGPQKIESLGVRIYQRAAGEDKGGWFAANGGDTTWDGHRLQINFNGNAPGIFVQGQLGLDLVFNQKVPAWTGSYTRNGVTKPVLLARPGASRKAASNPFTGGWLENGRFGAARCVHIAQGSDGAFVSWRDSRAGPIIDPNVGMTSAIFHENDGDALGVQITDDTVTLQEGIYWSVIAGQLPQKFTGKLSPDQSQIIGTWIPDHPLRLGQQHDKVPTFTRLSGTSCWSRGSN